VKWALNKISGLTWAVQKFPENTVLESVFLAG